MHEVCGYFVNFLQLTLNGLCAFQRLYIFEGENMSTLKNTFFIAPPETPTQAGPDNIFYDFNDGARVLLPEGKWHVRLLDADRDIKRLTGNLNVPG
jgi:hypothetical protein